MARLRRLQESDLDNCLALSTEANWNQVRADWLDLFARADCFGLELEGHIIATATSLPHPQGVAWIGMVLVRESQRGHGYARRVFEAALDAAAASRYVGLDATELGEPVYRKFGFEVTGEVSRWRRDPAPFEKTVRAGDFAKPGRTAWHFIGRSMEELESTLSSRGHQPILWDRLEPAEPIHGFERTRRLKRMFLQGRAPAAGQFESFALRGFEYGI